jgi:cupin fold WbuC family metalloprotein
LNRVDLARIEKVVAAARASARLRMNDNLHAMDDPIHRLLNATEPGTYVQPHRHLLPPKVETMAVLRGRGAILLLDDAGEVIERAVLSPEGPVLVAEVPAGTWHTLIALAPSTVWFEVKSGPYAPPAPAEIAPFAPGAGTPEAGPYLARLVREALVRDTTDGR